MEKTLKLYKLPPTEKTINVIGVVRTSGTSDFPTTFRKGDYLLQIVGDLIPTATRKLFHATDNSDAIPSGEWYECAMPLGTYFRDLSIPLTDIDTTKIYYLNDGNYFSEYTDIYFPGDNEQAEIFDFTYNASRMGNAPTISATLYNKRCLDDNFQDPVFTIFGGNVFTVDKTPTSSISNTESNKGYKHEITFVSDRIILEHLYFFDVVYQGDNATQDHPCSNNTTFSFYGRIDQFAQRLRNTLAYHGILNETSGFTVVIDDDVNYTDPTEDNFIEENLVSFEDKTILESLNEMFSVYDVPYYFVGHTIHIGYFNQHDWAESFEYGYEHSLLSVKKSNTTSKLIDICTGWGSEENIPYFYPNFTPNGIVPVYVPVGGGAEPDIRIVNPYLMATLGFSTETTPPDGTIFTYKKLNYTAIKSLAHELTGTYYNSRGERVLYDNTGGPNNLVRYTSYGDEYQILAKTYVLRDEHNTPSYYRFYHTVGTYTHNISFYCKNNILITIPDTHPTYHGFSGIHFNLDLKNEILDEYKNIRKINVKIETTVPGNGPFYHYENGQLVQDPNGYIAKEYEYTDVSNQNSYLIDEYLPVSLLTYNNQQFRITVKYDCYVKYFHEEFITWSSYYGIPSDSDPRCYTEYDLIVYEKMTDEELRVFGTFNSWAKDNNDFSANIGKYGLKIEDDFTPALGDYIYFVQQNYIPYTTRLCPPIYRRTLGERLFYEAKNYPFRAIMQYPQGGGQATAIVDRPMGEDEVIISSVKNIKNDSYKDDENVQYVFENEYDETRPHEHVERFDDIKPTIEGITNTHGLRIDMFSEFAYDENDSDARREDGKYIHPYFYGKLRKTNHASGLGFNLFDCASDGGKMTFSMTSGSCGGCNFEIRVDQNGNNTVMVDANGNLRRWTNDDTSEDYTDDSSIWGNVRLGTPTERQQDTENHEVWVCLAKDDETYGVLMPNAQNLYRPRGDNWDENEQNPVSNNGDTFVILNINLPSTYVAAAEERLMHEIIKHMHENNIEKFSYSLSLSKVFYAENNTFLQLDTYLNESAKVPIVYADENINDIYYVSSFTYKMASTSSQPDVTLELKDKFKRKRRFSEIINIHPQIITPTSKDGGFSAQSPTPELQTTIPNLVVENEIVIGTDGIGVGSQLARNTNDIAAIQQSDTKEKIWGQIGNRVEVKNIFKDGGFSSVSEAFGTNNIKSIDIAEKGGLTKEKCVVATFDQNTDAKLELNQYIPCSDNSVYTAAILQSLVDESDNVGAVLSVTYYKGDKTEISNESLGIDLTSDWRYIVSRIQPVVAAQYMRIAISVSRGSDTTLKIDNVQVLNGDYADTTLSTTEPTSLFPTKFVKNSDDDTSYADNSVKKFHADKVGEMYEDISESGAEVSVINGLDVEKYYYCNLTESSLTRTILLNSSSDGVATHVLFLNPSNQQKTLTLVGNIVGNMNIISNENPIAIPATSYRLVTFYKHPSIYFCHAENACTYQNTSLSNYLFCVPQNLEICNGETKGIRVVSDTNWTADADDTDTISLSHDSGTGNGYISVTTDYTGRDNDSNAITVDNGILSREIPVTIKGKDEFVRFTELGYTTENKTATLNVTGVSNSKRLTFYIEGVNNEMIVVPQSYTADGNTTQNGGYINGDPGSDSEYEFSISIQVNVDSDVKRDVTCILRIDADTFGIYDKCTIGYIEPRKTFNIVGKYNDTTHHLIGKKDQSGNFIILGNKQ
jgi:hypothetical protein